jgi:hypothetical protein
VPARPAHARGLRCFLLYKPKVQHCCHDDAGTAAGKQCPAHAGQDVRQPQQSCRCHLTVSGSGRIISTSSHSVSHRGSVPGMAAGVPASIVVWYSPSNHQISRARPTRSAAVRIIVTEAQQRKACHNSAPVLLTKGQLQLNPQIRTQQMPQTNVSVCSSAVQSAVCQPALGRCSISSVCKRHPHLHTVSSPQGSCPTPSAGVLIVQS